VSGVRETQFNSEVIKSLRAEGAWCYKIPDSPTSWTMRQTRFTPAKPCDIVGCYLGEFFAIEGKQMKKFQAFGLRQLRDGQIKSLNEIEAAGGKAFVFLNVRIKRPLTNNLYVFFWPEYKLIWENGPLKKRDLEGLIPIKGGKGVFPLADFRYRFV